ncbi:iron-sulfur cluster carrier protein ApbC [Gilvimarinus sp. F26214L]|uniref:iron-sulfur cluster carrier protein ApbC n=1 Tax=Gilvimarinus sp. DZF01 TaxID=3461371 RepID=UPI0040457792
MSHASLAAIETALGEFKDPVLNQSLRSLDALELDEQGGVPHLRVALGYPCAGLAAELESALREEARNAGFSNLELEVKSRIMEAVSAREGSISGVKNLIAVASGKGGVGKSTTAANLALALAAEGARVGLLDADIYGPSQPQMLGAGNQRPKVVDNRYMMPIEAHGLKTNSMGFLVSEQTPMVWRGPMVSGAFQQLIKQTHWGELDYLIIDMPPGTGDVQLTLTQSVPVTGAVIVTTPQDIALLDARKGIEMFRKVNVPVLGVVENMAVHVCSQCGHEEHIFGTGGGEEIARKYHTPLLGSLPLDLRIRQQVDSGCPTVVAEPASPVARAYREIARRIGAELWQINRLAAATEISISDD